MIVQAIAAANRRYDYLMPLSFAAGSKTGGRGKPFFAIFGDHQLNCCNATETLLPACSR